MSGKRAKKPEVRRREVSIIIQSLSVLGIVIKAQVDISHGKDYFVPYRDSKLSFLLKVTYLSKYHVDFTRFQRFQSLSLPGVRVGISSLCLKNAPIWLAPQTTFVNQVQIFRIGHSRKGTETMFL